MLLNLTHTHRAVTSLAPTNGYLSSREGGSTSASGGTPQRRLVSRTPLPSDLPKASSPGDPQRRRTGTPSGCSTLLPPSPRPPSPVGDWTCVCLLQPTPPPPQAPKPVLPSRECTICTAHFGWLGLFLIDGWMSLPGCQAEMHVSLRRCQ